MKTVIDLIREGLVAKGYAGLCNAIRECGCPVDDLAPNGSDCDIQECEPAMYRECKDCNRRNIVDDSDPDYCTLDSKNYKGGDCFYVPEDEQ